MKGKWTMKKQNEIKRNELVTKIANEILNDDIANIGFKLSKLITIAINEKFADQLDEYYKLYANTLVDDIENWIRG